MTDPSEIKMEKASIPPETIARLRNTRAKVIDFYRAKFARLNVPFVESRIPEVVYLKPFKLGDVSADPQDKELSNTTAGAGLDLEHGLIFISVDESNLDELLIASYYSHELSHALTTGKWRVYWSTEKGEPEIVWKKGQLGLETIGNKQRKASALENGFAMLDQKDIYTNVLGQLYPDEIADLNDTIQYPIIQNPLALLDKEPYTPLNHSDIPICMHTLTMKADHPQLPSVLKFPTLVGPLMKNMRLVEGICKIVGKNLTDETGADYFEIGRQYLDKYRYTGSAEGLRTIVDIFGGRDAKALFEADDRGRQLDEAMKIVRKKEFEMGLQ